MANMMDYLDWRGDLTLEHSPWCEIDSLILASFCYNDLGDIPKTREITLSALAPTLDLMERTGNQYFEQWRTLLYVMADTARFGNIRIHNYVDVLDTERATQFSAMTIELDDGVTYVAFRGTDNTLVGWREDFNMSYETVPAQAQAWQYLEEVAMKSNRVLVGGHSKGGNLAAYAAVHVSQAAQKKIIGVYSFDGPGLDKVSMSSQAYERIQPMIHSIVPQSSVVGLLMNYHPEYTVVRSTAVSLLQHDAFTWQLKGTQFETMDAVDKSSQLMDQTVHDWLSVCTPDQRAVFVDTMFRMLDATHATTVAELSAEKLRSAAAMVSATREMDTESRKMFNHLLGQFIGLGASNFLEMITKPRYVIKKHPTPHDAET